MILLSGTPLQITVQMCHRGAAQPSNFLFEMHRGVMRVWTDASRAVEVGKVPGSDYNFFSDMQRRVFALISSGHTAGLGPYLHRGSAASVTSGCAVKVHASSCSCQRGCLFFGTC